MAKLNREEPAIAVLFAVLRGGGWVGFAV